MKISLRRLLLASAGSVFLVLGIIGIFLPLLPTTPFFLLSAALWMRSSKRLYNWLLNNRFFGSYIRNYREGKGLSMGIKTFTISLLWITIGISAIFFISILLIRVLLFLIAVGVSVHLLVIPTYRKSQSIEN